mmetsp:Transcript_5285/g.9393  ORF Transcript_5285/g.9393 Transcript_5285/m.9393 type:complete len:204 (-) Transcript_5285:58-669(-)
MLALSLASWDQARQALAMFTTDSRKSSRSATTSTAQRLVKAQRERTARFSLLASESALLLALWIAERLQARQTSCLRVRSSEFVAVLQTIVTRLSRLALWITVPFHDSTVAVASTRSLEVGTPGACRLRTVFDFGEKRISGSTLVSRDVTDWRMPRRKAAVCTTMMTSIHTQKTDLRSTAEFARAQPLNNVFAFNAELRRATL